MAVSWSNITAQPPILGFGCARLTANNSVREALRNLGVAYDLGIRYFDTARLYGYGRAEAILGNFIRDKREKVIIATKAGLNPREFHGMIGLGMLNLARKSVKVLSGFRKTSASGTGPLIEQRITDPRLLKQSLERSLKELRTEYVDVFLLHEFTIEEANRDGVVRFCEDVIHEGKVHRIGIGSESCRDIRNGDLHKVYTMIQHEYDLSHGEQYEPLDTITRSVHGIYRMSKRTAETINDPLIFKRIEEIVGFEVDAQKGFHQVMLKCAQVQNSSGIVLFASSENERISATINAWQSPRLTLEQVSRVTEVIQKHAVHV